MRGHVVCAFCGMNKQAVTIWHLAAKKGFHIHQNVSIVIFVNQQTGGGVLNIQRKQTRDETKRIRPCQHLRRNVVQFTALSWYAELF